MGSEVVRKVRASACREGSLRIGNVDFFAHLGVHAEFLGVSHYADDLAGETTPSESSAPSDRVLVWQPPSRQDLVDEKNRRRSVRVL
jgi:hypothetical protein